MNSNDVASRAVPLLLVGGSKSRIDSLPSFMSAQQTLTVATVHRARPVVSQHDSLQFNTDGDRSQGSTKANPADAPVLVSSFLPLLALPHMSHEGRTGDATSSEYQLEITTLSNLGP
jgi:hypothetical protein